MTNQDKYFLEQIQKWCDNNGCKITSEKDEDNYQIIKPE